jgi:APA family basic amino acid/polyamine antiporter
MSSTEAGESASSSGDLARAAGDGGGLFVRKSSGLVREMGWRDAFSVSQAGINPSTVVALFLAFDLVFVPDSDLALPLIVAALIMVPLTLTYSFLVAALPRSGGDYVYHSRIFHPVWGAIVGGAVLVLFIVLLGANSVFVGQTFVPQFFVVLADVFNSGPLTEFSETMSTSQFAQYIASALVVVLGCAIGMRGSHALGRFMFWCFVAGMIAVAITVFESLTHSTSDFKSAYDAHTHAGAYNGVIAAAKNNGVETGNTFSGFIKILPFAATGFWGFTIGNFPSGEMKRAGKTYLAATLGGLLVAVIILVVAWLGLKGMAGLHFLQSAASLSNVNPEAFEHVAPGASTATPFYTDIVTSSPVLRLLMSGGFVIGGLLFPLAMILCLSRVIFAFSFDRLLPKRLADVSARSHAPINALLLVLVIGLGTVALVIYSTGYLKVTRNGVLILATLMALAGVAGMALPYRRPDIFDGAPKIISGTWLGIPPVVVISAVVFLTQGFLVYYAATNESVSGGYELASISFLIGAAVLGLVLYIVSRIYLKNREGIDLSLAMRELPPE